MNELNKVLEEIKIWKVKNVGVKINEEDLLKESVTIRKSVLKKLAKELMKEIDRFLHDEYIITTFPKLKLDQEKFDESKKMFKDEIESLNILTIFHILNRIKLDDEIDGDLYYKKVSYLDLVKVLWSSYSYLEAYYPTLFLKD